MPEIFRESWTNIFYPNPSRQLKYVVMAYVLTLPNAYSCTAVLPASRLRTDVELRAFVRKKLIYRPPFNEIVPLTLQTISFQLCIVTVTVYDDKKIIWCIVHKYLNSFEKFYVVWGRVLTPVYNQYTGQWRVSTGQYELSVGGNLWRPRHEYKIFYMYVIYLLMHIVRIPRARLKKKGRITIKIMIIIIIIIIK